MNGLYVYLPPYNATFKAIVHVRLRYTPNELCFAIPIK